MVQWFCLVSWVFHGCVSYLEYWFSMRWINFINVDQWPIFHGPVSFAMHLEFLMNVILYIYDNDLMLHKDWSHLFRSDWPIFHGSPLPCLLGQSDALSDWCSGGRWLDHGLDLGSYLFVEIWWWNNFYGHSPLIADSSWAVVWSPCIYYPKRCQIVVNTIPKL